MTVAAILLAAEFACPAQDAGAVTGWTADPQIVSALKQVSAQRIQATVEKLVSYYNRSTLSSADPDLLKAERGITAARLWIVSEYERYSRECGGCLHVETYKFVQEPGERVPNPTEIVDVYAVLKGTDPANAKRIVLVTGHYDSRNSDPLDAKGFAPGANDDASGTAVSLRLGTGVCRWCRRRNDEKPFEIQTKIPILAAKDAARMGHPQYGAGRVSGPTEAPLLAQRAREKWGTRCGARVE